MPDSHFTVGNYLIITLADHAAVNSEVLLTAMFYIEKSLDLPVDGADDHLAELLEKESFSEEISCSIKGYLINFAAETKNLRLFQQAVGVLSLFNDPKLQSLFNTWLDRQLRHLLDENAAVRALLLALERSCAPIRIPSCGIGDVETHIDLARKYLNEQLGVRHSW